MRDIVKESQSGNFPVVTWEDTEKYDEEARELKSKKYLSTTPRKLGIKVEDVGGIYRDKDSLLVVSASNNEVYKYGSDNSLIKKIGGMGNEAGQFVSPASIAKHGNEYYIIDNGNHRIQVFDEALNYLSEIKLPEADKDTDLEFSSIAIDGDGKIYLSCKDLHNSGVYLYDAEKKEFANIQKYFYGTLYEHKGSVYAVEQASIYVDLDKKEMGARKGPNHLWRFDGDKPKKICTLPVGRNISSFAIVGDNIIGISTFHRAVTAFDAESGKYLGDLCELEDAEDATCLSNSNKTIYFSEDGKTVKVLNVGAD